MRSTTTLWHIVRAATRLSTVLGALLIVIVWTSAFLYLRLDYEKSMEAARSQSANLARLFDENVDRSIKEIDKTLLILRTAYERDPASFDLPAWTSNAYHLKDLTLQVGLIGADGMLKATNVARNPVPLDLSDREHFIVHKNSVEDKLFISKPLLGRASGKWTVQLTRRVIKPDGSFDGVLVVSLDPYHLSKFFEQVDIGPHGSVTLIGTDGIIRARGGLDTSSLGKSLAGTEVFDLIKSNSAGLYVAGGRIDGYKRLVAYRVMKDFPLVTLVGFALDDIVADHQRIHRFVTLAAAVGTVLLLLVTLTSIVHELHLHRAREARRLADRLAKEKSDDLEATFCHMSQGIVMLDPGGAIRIANPRAAELLGPVCDLSPGAPLPTPLRVEPRPEDAGTPGLGAHVFDYETPAGLVVEVGTDQLPDGGCVVTLTDITARKRNEYALAEARDRAEAASRTRTAFLAVMSHEMRTPLNGVVGMATLLEATPLDAEQSACVKTLRRSADHLLVLINDVLDFTKLESGHLEFEACRFDLADLVAGTVDMIRPVADEKHLSMHVEIADDVPAAVVGDPARLRQIILNLVGNAVKFTSRGAVTVVLRAGSTGASCCAPIEIEVRDTGIGIEPEDLPRLFKEFVQVDGSIQRRFGGTGLGLAISRKLARRMDGDIAVESRPGVGSRFTLRVVLGRASAEALPAAPSEAGPGAPGGGEALHLPARLATMATAMVMPAHGRDILVAEDNATNMLVVTRILETLGHRVTGVGDGRAAVDAVASRHFDLVLMDVMMPGLDGLSAIREIRAGGGPDAGIPIIVLTANAHEEEHRDAIAAGADGFTTKPIDRATLAAVIEWVLSAAARRSALPAGTAPAVAVPAVLPTPSDLGDATPVPPPVLSEVPSVQASAVDAAPAALDAPAAVPGPDAVDPAGEVLASDVLVRFYAEVGEATGRMIVEAFVADTARTLRALPGLPLADLVREAHAIKSSAATFGLSRLSRRARDLEKGAADLDEAARASAVADLAEDFTAAATAIAAA